MAATYEFICIPLDTRDPRNAPLDFQVQIVSRVLFPMGTTHDPASVRDALLHHPLLSSSAQIRAYVWRFDLWRANANRLNRAVAIPVTLHYSGTTPREELL